jgi:protoheme IX farnesyltransferase
MNSTLASLVKLPISLLISVSAFTGYFLAHPFVSIDLFLAVSGTFLLACGGAGLNNYQDRDIDRLCERTRHRPLAAGRISENKAWVLIAAFTVSGLAALYLVNGHLRLPLLGASAIVLYNLVYTPLKRITQYAVIFGAVCGMIPPVIGWLAGGGRVTDPAILALVIIIGVWQLPHFWLKSLAYKADHDRSGLPGMLTSFSHPQVSRILCIWVIAFAVLTLCLPLFGIVSKPLNMILLGANAAALIGIFAFYALSRTDSFQVNRLFRFFNFSLGVIMGLIILEQVSFR